MKVILPLACAILSLGGSSTIADNSVQQLAPFEIQLPSFSIEELLCAIDNRDLAWHQGYAGIHPILSPNGKALLNAMDLEVFTALGQFIDNPYKCGIAHVLMTLGYDKVAPKREKLIPDYSMFESVFKRSCEPYIAPSVMEQIAGYWKPKLLNLQIDILVSDLKIGDKIISEPDVDLLFQIESIQTDE